jgi:hypothetical protein
MWRTILILEVKEAREMLLHVCAMQDTSTDNPVSETKGSIYYLKWHAIALIWAYHQHIPEENMTSNDAPLGTWVILYRYLLGSV